MLDDILHCLACPHCGEPLARDGASLRCVNRHSFDVARQGYASLLRGDVDTKTADTAEMVAARAAFLAAGHYAGLADAIAAAAAEALAAAGPGCVVDVGAGTGYYLANVLEAAPGRVGVALDLSKHAARAAARAHGRIGAAAADTWGRLPLRDRAAALVLDVFAPRNADEFRRVLRADGVLVVATPTPRHLAEIVGPLGMLAVDERKGERLAAQLEGRFSIRREWTHEQRLSLDRTDTRHLVLMGPSAHHADAAALEVALAALPEPVEVTLSVAIAVCSPLER